VRHFDIGAVGGFNRTNLLIVASHGFRSLLAQFRPTPKAKTGLASSEAVVPLAAFGQIA